jgi:hypothetical protein
MMQCTYYCCLIIYLQHRCAIIALVVALVVYDLITAFLDAIAQELKHIIAQLRIFK